MVDSKTLKIAIGAIIKDPVMSRRIPDYLSDTHVEKPNSVQEFIDVKSWLLLTFSICLRNQLKFHNSTGL